MKPHRHHPVLVAAMRAHFDKYPAGITGVTLLPGVCKICGKPEIHAHQRGKSALKNPAAGFKEPTAP